MLITTEAAELVISERRKAAVDRWAEASGVGEKVQTKNETATDFRL